MRPAQLLAAYRSVSARPEKGRKRRSMRRLTDRNRTRGPPEACVPRRRARGRGRRHAGLSAILRLRRGRALNASKVSSWRDAIETRLPGGGSPSSPRRRGEPRAAEGRVRKRFGGLCVSIPTASRLECSAGFCSRLVLLGGEGKVVRGILR